jgi:hypothetical protein
MLYLSLICVPAKYSNDYFCSGCDNEIHNDGHAVDSLECSNMCAGDATEVCGGGLRLTVWTKAPSVLESYKNWAVAGCYMYDCVPHTVNCHELTEAIILEILLTLASSQLLSTSPLLSRHKNVWILAYLRDLTMLVSNICM